MRVLHFSTTGKRGGAGQATWRLHRALASFGMQSRVLSLNASDQDADLLHFDVQEQPADDRARSFRELFIDSNRTSISNTWFSAEIEGFDVSCHPAVQEADILHLHWVSGFLSTPHVAQLLATGKPVVWTLHDMAPFTGGCHYSAGCSGFQTGCLQCPQLEVFSDTIPAAQLADKQALLQGGRMQFIALNAWMAELLKQSPSFAKRKVSVIPNGVDLDRFRPDRREDYRKEMGIAPNAFVALFVADSLIETRKGSALFAESLKIMGHSSAIVQAAAEGRLIFLVAGKDDFPTTGSLPIKSLGWCEEEKMPEYYAAADLVVLPSLEDNLPNTVVEAFAAGTPVVGFPVGGIPEMVLEGQTGRLVPTGDANALAKTLTDLFFKPDGLKAMRPSCRAFAETHYDSRKNAQSVIKLYEDVLATHSAARAKHFKTFPGPSLLAFLKKPRLESLGRPPEELLTHTVAASTEALAHERNLLGAQLADLQKNFAAAEADRLVRGDVIQQQGLKLSALEADFDARLKELNALHSEAEALRNERNLLGAQLADLQKNFAAAEADRLVRGDVIQQQGLKLSALEADFDTRLKELNALHSEAEAVRNERNLLGAQLADLQKNFAAAEADRLVRGDVIQQQGLKLSALEADFDTRLKELNALHPEAEALRNERNLLGAQLADLQKNFAAAEADRLVRGDVIQQQGLKFSALGAELDTRLKELNNLYVQFEVIKNERNLLGFQLTDLKKQFEFVEADRLIRAGVIAEQGRQNGELQLFSHQLQIEREDWRRKHAELQEKQISTEARLSECSASQVAMGRQIQEGNNMIHASTERAAAAEKSLHNLHSKWWVRLAKALRIY